MGSGIFCSMVSSLLEFDHLLLQIKKNFDFLMREPKNSHLL